MSITGKGPLSIKKGKLKESLVPSTGFKKVRALHKAADGDTSMDLTGLTAPSGAEAPTYVAPSLGDLTATNLTQFKENITLRSTLRGAMLLDLDWSVSGSSKINFVVPATEDEIFEVVIDHNPRTGVSLIDAKPLVCTGELAIGATDFNVGEAFEVGKFPSAQHGAVLVYVDGQIAYRNTGNNPAGAGVTGDYYEVPAGAGLAVVIRFNTPDLSKARQISIVSIGALAERPNGTQQQFIEALQGQIDAMVPTLALLAGVPETDFQATPNDLDLKAFGDCVFQNKTDIAAETAARIADYRKVKEQFEEITGSVTLGSTTVPRDNTIPQITEGNEVFNFNYTPDTLGSKIVFHSRIKYKASTTQHSCVYSLYIDGDADAVKVDARVMGFTGGVVDLELRHEFIISSLSSINFQTRVGADTVNVSLLNVGSDNSSTYGDKINSWAKVEEFAPPGVE